jgi:signal transduction histidine kinase
MIEELTISAHAIADEDLAVARSRGGAEVRPPCLDELLGTVAHELRNPLASVLGGVSVMTSEGDPGPVARRLLPGMERQLRQAMRLVDDLFDLCAGSRDRLRLHKELVEVAEIVTRATDATAHLLEARRHRLTVSLPPWPVFLVADPGRLEQVLANLLANAAKFTDPGGHIHLSAEAGASDVVLRIRDNGRGIDPDLLPQVFDLFRQGHDGHGGLGIGLALVKSLVELHGGSVAAHSNGPGAGAEFVVHLPRRARGS